MQHLPTLRLIAALLPITLGSVISLVNWSCLYASWRDKRFHSPVGPLIGAALLAVGMLMIPMTQPWARLAVVADWGTLVFLLSLPHIVKTEWGYCRFTRIATYVGSRGSVTVTLNLNRNALMVLKFDIKLKPGECGLAGSGNTGTWTRSSERLQVQAGDLLAEFEIDGGNGLSSEVLRCVSASGKSVGGRDDTALEGFVLTKQ